MATLPDTPAVDDPTLQSMIADLIAYAAELRADVDRVQTGISNGGMESWEDGEPVGWVATAFSGGSYSEEVTTVVEGERSIKMTATGGGGYVELVYDDLLPVAAGIDDVFFDGKVRFTTTARVQGQILFYDDESSPSVVKTITFLDTDIDTGYAVNTWHRFRGWARAGSTSKFYRLKFIVGDSSPSSPIAGDVYLDGMTSRINDPYPVVTLDTKANFYSSASTGFHNVPVPVLGTAYTAGISIVDTGPGASVEYLYNADTGNFVDVTGTNSTVGGDLLDEGGELQYEYHGTGTFTLYYGSWR